MVTCPIPTKYKDKENFKCVKEELNPSVPWHHSVLQTILCILISFPLELSPGMIMSLLLLPYCCCYCYCCCSCSCSSCCSCCSCFCCVCCCFILMSIAGRERPDASGANQWAFQSLMLWKLQKTPVTSLNTEQGLQPASPVGTWELTPFSSQTTRVEEGHMASSWLRPLGVGSYLQWMCNWTFCNS